jgi:hypothetical protein
MDKWGRIVIVALSLLLMITTISLILSRSGKTSPERVVEYIHTRDTVIKWKYDTDTVYMTNTRIKYETKVINDTVWIKDEPVTTTDSTSNYVIDINAVKLNWYRLRMMKNDTITINTTTVKTISSPKSGFFYGLGVGAGYGIVNRKPDIFVGGMIGYRF